MSELDCFIGCWTEAEKQGYEEMAQALGIPEKKKEEYDHKTCITYSRNGDDWTIRVGKADLGSETYKKFDFNLGKPYTSEDLDGSSMQSLVSADGSKLVEKHKNESGLELDIVRWIENGDMKVQTNCHGFSMMSTYKKT